MTIIITKNTSKKDIETSLEKISKSKRSKGLRKYFGISRTKTDAVAFQKKVRNEWN